MAKTNEDRRKLYDNFRLIWDKLSKGEKAYYAGMIPPPYNKQRTEKIIDFEKRMVGKYKIELLNLMFK